MQPEENKQEQAIWRIGYDMGYEKALSDKREEIEIGDAILKVLDERYEFKDKSED